MLPNLRLVPVGGVFFAIFLFALQLAFGQGQVSRAVVAPVETPARGPLIARDEHPEWRQFLILAAARRADEIGRLSALPDTPVRVEEPQAEEPPARLQLAAIPDNRNEADPDDTTGSVGEGPSATLPVEIGETSSTELPISDAPEQPPVMRIPRQERPAHQSRKGSSRGAQLKPATEPASPLGLLGQLLGALAANQQQKVAAAGQ